MAVKIASQGSARRRLCWWGTASGDVDRSSSSTTAITRSPVLEITTDNIYHSSPMRPRHPSRRHSTDNIFTAMIDHTSDLPIPGSVQLVQVGPGHVEGGKGGHHVAQAADIVLHPRPSSDVNDPLNWTKRRKRLATFCLVICKCIENR